MSLRLDPVQVAWALVVVGSALPVVAIAVLGLSNRFQADDFSIAARLIDHGFFGAWVDELRSLNGRFAGYFFANALVKLGAHNAHWATWLMHAALIGAVWCAVPPQPDRDIVRRLAVAAALTAALVLAAPAPEQALLWISAIGMGTASLVLAPAAIALARRGVASAGGRPRIAWLVASALAAFLASGSYETTGVLVFLGALGAALAVGWRDRHRGVAAVSIGTGALLGLLVMAVIPGTSSRKTDLVYGMGVGDAIEFGVREGVAYAGSLLATDVMWVAFVAGLIAAAPKLSAWQALRWALVGAVATLAAFCAAMALSGWSLGMVPPGRTLASFVGLFAAFLFMLGWLVPLPRQACALVGLLFVALAVQFSRPLFDSIDGRRAWAAAWDRRDAVLHSAPGRGVVTVEALPSTAGLEDFTEDPTFWVNGAAALYYNVEGITAVPPSS